MTWLYLWVVMVTALGGGRGTRGGEVTYDRRSLIINGERKLLFSGSIHYARSTPEVLALFKPVFFFFFRLFFQYT